MSFKSAFRSKLEADATVSALVGVHNSKPCIFWGVRPQKSPYPALVLSRVADTRDQHMQGFAGYRPTRVQIDCYATTAPVADALYEAAFAAAVVAETVEGVRFLRAFLNTELDRGDQTETGFIHREMIDLTCWHNA